MWINPVLGGVHKLRLQDLTFFDHLTPSVYIFYGIKVYKKSIFLTPYPPLLVNVVCEGFILVTLPLIFCADFISIKMNQLILFVIQINLFS